MQSVRTDPNQPIALYFEPSGKVRPITMKSLTGWSGGEYDAINQSMTRNGNATASEIGYAYISEVNVWVRRCIEIRASNLKRLDWYIEDKSTGKRIENHPLSVAMKRSRHFFQRVERSLLIWGELYIKPLKNDYDYYSDVWWLNNLSVNFDIVNGVIRQFYFAPLHGGKPYVWHAGEVCYIYTENAFDDLRGSSKVLAVLQEANVHEEIARAAQAHFANDARPGIMFIPEMDMGVPQSQEFIQYWKDNFQGSWNTNKPVVLPMQIKSVQTLERAKMEDDVTFRESIRREICASFGVPLSVAGAWDDASYQSAPAQRISLYEETIIPEAEQVAEDLTRDLLPFFGSPEKERVWFDGKNLLALAEDKQAKAAALNQQLVSGGLTLDEYRIALDMEELPDARGKVFYVPSGITVTPVEKLGTMPPPQPPGGGGFGFQSAPAIQVDKPPVPALPSGEVAEEPAKAAGSCTLMLSLANDPGLIQLQNQLKQQPGSEYVQWSDPASFHVTMVHIPAATDEQITELPSYQHEFTTGALSLNVGSLASFDKAGRHALFFRVRENAALRAYQRELYTLCRDAGMAVSPYNTPEGWQPHITMGYSTQPMRRKKVDTGLNVTPGELVISVDRDGRRDEIYRGAIGGGQPVAKSDTWTHTFDFTTSDGGFNADAMTGSGELKPTAAARAEGATIVNGESYTVTVKPDVDPFLEELSAYRKFVINRWDNPKSRPFNFKVITEPLKTELVGQVKACTTRAQALKLFDGLTQALAANWSESDHPRDPDGQFGNGGGGSDSGGGDKKPESDKPDKPAPKPDKKPNPPPKPKPAEPPESGGVTEGKPAWAGDKRKIGMGEDGYLDYGHIEDNPTNVLADMQSKQMSREQTGKLNNQQKLATKTYTGEAYTEINGGLRSGKIPPGHQQTVKELDSAIGQSTLPENTVLYRGMEMNSTLRENIKPGATFTDKAYTSTSLDQGNPDRFAGGENGAVMRVKAPAGQKGLALQSISDYPEEKEVLLPRGTSYKITSVTRDPSTGRTYIDAEIIGEAA